MLWGFPGGTDGKESAYNTGDISSVSGFGRCPGEGNGYPLRYSCLENSMDRGAWQATVYVISKSQKQLSDQHTHSHAYVIYINIYTHSSFDIISHNDLS